jgi:predicted Rossmann fold flavoprotein
VQTSDELYDVIIIGGGPSGLMASIAARSAGTETLIIEKGNKLGRKLGISGGGRCNVTNAKPLPELMQNILGNPKFLYSALNRYSNTDIITFFESLGIRLKEEDRGRVFPITDKAATVVKALVDKVYELGVEIWTDMPVRKLVADHGRITGVLLQDGNFVRANAIVVSTGGCSVPKTGSTGDAYPWARKLGHTIVDPYPTEVPLTSDDRFISERTLQGLSLRDIDMTVWRADSKKLTTEHGDMIFTHLGLSGPAALRCSHYVSTSLRDKPQANLSVTIDCNPSKSKAELMESLEQIRKTDKRKHLANVLTEWLPERLVDVVLALAKTDGGSQMANVQNRVLLQIVELIKAFPVQITGTLPLSQATVTGGGVSIKEINPKTMGSKLCEGLYFSGEVMDVHAHTGGYNITVAFSTGNLAGTSAAEFALSHPKLQTSEQ